MDFEVSVAESGKYLICRAYAPITEEITRGMVEELAKLTAATGIEDRLVDVRNVRNVMSVTTNYDLAYKNMEAMQIERSVKVASLQTRGDTSHEFVCIAIRNSGFNLRVFHEEAPAIAWLEE